MVERFPWASEGQSLYFCRIDLVRPGEPANGVGENNQWIADVTVTGSAAPVEAARVVGHCLPMSHTPERPSFGVLGYFSGDSRQPWVMPIGWSSYQSAVKAMVMIQEFDNLAIGVSAAGEYSIESRPGGTVQFDNEFGEGSRVGASGAAVRLLSVDKVSVRAFDGSNRVARGYEAGGDKIAITAETSPGLLGWMQSISACFGLVGTALALAVPGDAGAMATALGNLTQAVGDITAPRDTVPAVGDLPEQPASGTLQVVGEIRTGTGRLLTE